MIPTFRVSNVAAYKRWRDDPESPDVGWLLNQITGSQQTPAMAKGTAFHKFLEHSMAGNNYDGAEIDGYRFTFDGDFELYRPATREWRQGKDYGGIIVSGQCDSIEGATIYDDKTTEHFDPENYLEGVQWKYYLDIFEASRFVWNVWVMKLANDEDVPTYSVKALHRLEQYRYPKLSDECKALALEFKDFAAETGLIGKAA